MLVGHCAAALAGKRAEPKLSLGTLMAAAVLADLLGFIFILAGVEHWTINSGRAGVIIRVDAAGASYETRRVIRPGR